MMQDDREFWLLVRRALLMLVDAIDRYKLAKPGARDATESHTLVASGRPR